MRIASTRPPGQIAVGARRCGSAPTARQGKSRRTAELESVRALPRIGSWKLLRELRLRSTTECSGLRGDRHAANRRTEIFRPADFHRLAKFDDVRIRMGHRNAAREQLKAHGLHRPADREPRRWSRSPRTSGPGRWSREFRPRTLPDPGCDRRPAAPSRAAREARPRSSTNPCGRSNSDASSAETRCGFGPWPRSRPSEARFGNWQRTAAGDKALVAQAHVQPLNGVRNRAGIERAQLLQIRGREDFGRSFPLEQS